MGAKRDAALMPDAEAKKSRAGNGASQPPSPSPSRLVSFVQGTSSILTRLGVFLFLRWVPSSLAWPALPIAFAIYAVCWLGRDWSISSNRAAANELQQLANNVDVKEGKIGKTIGNEHTSETNAKPSRLSLFGALRALVTGVSTPLSRKVNLLNLAVHGLLFAFFLDSYASPYLFPSHYEHNLVFHRVADIGPTHAKVHVRWPDPIPLFEGLQEDVPGSGVLRDGMQRVTKPFRLVYRESVARTSPTVNRWERGPLLEIDEKDDWVATATLSNLWPSTEYEYRLAWAHNNTFVSPQRLIDFEHDWTQPHEDWLTGSAPMFIGGSLRTWPDPRAGKGMGGIVVASSFDDEDEYGDNVPIDDPNHFKFVTSSCVKPDFPYSPSQFGAWSWLLRLIPTPTPRSETDGWAKRNVIKGFDLLYERYIRDGVQTNVRFLLQLGDLIYADVPRFGGPALEGYRKLYRNLFASMSFRRVFAAIPMIGIYDDHEIKNNWAGLTTEGDVIEEFPTGNKAWQEYVGQANPEPLDEGENYYTFRYGSEAAFFIMDTRRYRVPSKGLGIDVEDAFDDGLTPETSSLKTMLGQKQKDALFRWLGATNSTATFKFVVSSVPFMSLWGGIDGKIDSWAAYLAERDELIDVMQYVPNVIVLSGDRHEAAVTGLRSLSSPDVDRYPILELSTSPLNMFYVPVRTLYQENGRGAVGQEKLLKYFPNGNHKWMDIEVDVRKVSDPKLVFRLWIDGKMAWKAKYLGQAVRASASGVGGIAQTFLQLLGWRPRRWF